MPVEWVMAECLMKRRGFTTLSLHIGRSVTLRRMANSQKLDDKELLPRWELARDIAHEAGQLTMRHFRSDDLQVEQKSDASPVTIADREAEQLLRDRILAAFPDDAIIGEELGESDGGSSFRWALDPIDGTKSFVSGVPLFATLVGVLHGDQSVAGVIYAPAVDETVYAARGQGCWHLSGNGPPVRAKVSNCSALKDAMFVTTEVASFEKYQGPGALNVFLRLQATARLTRTWGDAYGYLLVATGRADLMVDPALNIWDAAALQPIVEEAGGTFTDWSGVPTVHGREGVATNGPILTEALALLRD